MSNKKMTKREMFEQIKSKLSDSAEIAFVEHEIELLSKKNGPNKSLTPNQRENLAYRDVIVDFMSDGQRYTVSQLVKKCEGLNDMSSQRACAILRQMVDDGQVVRIEEKRIAYYSLVQ